MKEPEFQTDFDLFWAAYPRRSAKKDARKAWLQLRPSTEVVQAILDALVWQTKTDQWRRGIIPLPATYLRGERWEDERPAGGNGSPAPSHEQLAHVQAVRRRMEEARQQNLADMAAEYERTHPMFRQGKPS